MLDESRTITRRLRSTRLRLEHLHRLRFRTVRSRLTELEEALDENRQLNRRVAELTDLLTELLVPLARSDDDGVDAILQRYRSGI